MSEGTNWRTRWVGRIEAWEARADAMGLAGLWGALRDGFKPLAPVAAQLLWITQPTMALFGEADSISALADLLEHPDSEHPVPSEGA